MLMTVHIVYYTSDVKSGEKENFDINRTRQTLGLAVLSCCQLSMLSRGVTRLHTVMELVMEFS